MCYFEHNLGKINLTLRDLEGFCKVSYSSAGKNSKNPLPTIRAILHHLGMDEIPIHFNKYPYRPGLNVNMHEEGEQICVSVEYIEEGDL